MANQKQLNQMMRQVQKMQADMAAAQDALADVDGRRLRRRRMVTASVTGAGDLQTV